MQVCRYRRLPKPPRLRHRAWGASGPGGTSMHISCTGFNNICNSSYSNYNFNDICFKQSQHVDVVAAAHVVIYVALKVGC